MASTYLARLNTQEPWMLRTEAAKCLGKSESLIRTFVKKGVVREFRGDLIWVATEDVAYVLRCRSTRREPLHLGVRYSCTELLTPAPWDGRDIYSWAQQRQHAALNLEPPEKVGIPTDARRAQEADLARRVALLEGLVADLYSSKARVRALPQLSDAGVEQFIRSAHSALHASYLTLEQVDHWISFMEGLQDAHVGKVVQWANTNSSAAQELCGQGVSVLSLLWRLAAALRTYAAAADTDTPETRSRCARAEATYAHVEEMCQTRIMMERALLADGSRWLAVGLAPLDRRMLQCLHRKNRTS